MPEKLVFLAKNKYMNPKIISPLPKRHFLVSLKTFLTEEFLLIFLR